MIKERIIITNLMMIDLRVSFFERRETQIMKNVKIESRKLVTKRVIVRALAAHRQSRMLPRSRQLRKRISGVPRERRKSGRSFCRDFGNGPGTRDTRTCRDKPRALLGYGF